MGIASFPAKLQKSSSDEKIQHLQAVNNQLSVEVDRLYSFLIQTHPSLKKHEPMTLSASVLFREKTPWSTTLWVDRGARDGVEKNSIATVGDALLGVVDEVLEKKCRIRIITDPTLVPSVRANRGNSQHRLAHAQVQTLLNTLPHLDYLFADENEKKETLQHLALLDIKLIQDCENSELAKGELQGSGSPLWRKRSLFLRGTGFNYDCADDKGPSRPLSSEILRLGDLLVTTGMDGIFPEGLIAGVVTKVFPLREGDFCYDIEARMAVQNLDDLRTLHILLK
ncbi:MAG: hypothetical protein ChlgKO_06290 [Chlamydiales bacterium]